MEVGSQRDLLPIVGQSPPTPVSRSRCRAVAFHLLRIGMIVAIVWLIREQHREFVLRQAARDTTPLAIERLRKFYPNVTDMEVQGTKHAATTVLDGEGQSLGYFIQTSPQSDAIVGYSGPTNTLIAFDADSRILGIDILDILDSRDTKEHVADVMRDDLFMTALAGKTWDDAGAQTT